MSLHRQSTYKRLFIQTSDRRFNVKRIFKRFRITIGFVLLLILLTAVTIVTKHLLDVQTNDQAWVLHTQQILTQVAQAQSLMTNAETGQRAYITTGDPNYLGPYDLAVSQLEPNVQQLAELTKDNPDELAKIANLRLLVQTKMDMLSTNVLLFQSGNRDTARELAVSERGRLLTVQINNLINDLVREQASLKGSWSATYQSSVGRTSASIYLAGSMVAIGLIALAYYIVRDVNIRDRRARVRLVREKLFRSTLTSLGDAVISTDNGGLVTFLNPKAELLTGVKLMHAKGQPIEKVFPLVDEATLEPVANSITKVIEHRHPIDLKNQAFLKSGEGHLIPINESATLIRDSRDQSIGAVLVFRDATYERQGKEVLRNIDGFALSALHLANASRQIDVPLVAASDLLYIAKLNEGITPETSGLLTLAEQHLERVSHISREVLGFYREPAAPEPLDLSTVVDSVLRGFSGKFRSKNIAIKRDFHNCPMVCGVSVELNQAIANLVSNAVDAVPHGGTIHVRLSCPDHAGTKCLMLGIEDNGPGVSQTNRGRLFEPFFTTKEGTGYGLGLWTAKGIVEKHGGSIQVNFDVDHSSSGTVFNILLPIIASVELPTLITLSGDKHFSDTPSRSAGLSQIGAMTS